MEKRWLVVSLVVLAVLFCFCSAGLASFVYLTPSFKLQDVASAARMPIPGSADVELQARDYGLYFGMLNAPTRTVMSVPKLDITIVPPDGIPDPKFVEVTPKADKLVDGFHTSQVAQITVAVAGKYHIEVKSPDENGGSFSIGELPTDVNPIYNVIGFSPLISIPVGLSVILLVAAYLVNTGMGQGKDV